VVAIQAQSGLHMKNSLIKKYQIGPGEGSVKRQGIQDVLQSGGLTNINCQSQKTQKVMGQMSHQINP
jgi:hypothetical protein